VTYNPEQGYLGTLDPTQARALLAAAFQEWDDIPGLPVTFVEGPLLPWDVTGWGIPAGNVSHWLHYWRVDGDGRSPVIFDQTGNVIDGLFGVGARFNILGLAALDTPISATPWVTGASIVINGQFYDGVGLPNSPEDVESEEVLKSVMVHEIGHFLNLDHSLVNAELASDGNPGNDIYIPTMFPIAVEDEEAIATLNPDDKAAVLDIYTSPSGGSIRGVVRDSANVPFQGAQVILRKIDDPLMTAYSSISGGLFFPCNAGSTCDPCAPAPCDPGNPVTQGAYAVENIEPGSYTVCLKQIDVGLSVANGSFIGPLQTPPVVPGPEECFSVVETAVASDDDPDDAATVDGTVANTAVDLVVNALPLSDAFEPNDNQGSAATLDDLVGGEDTAPAVLEAGDLDFYAIPVVAGQIIQIDVEAAEIGSTLDPVIGLYDAGGAPVASSDDAIDDDSGVFSFDPALTYVADFSGTARLGVGSYPDTDLDGTDGATSGPYWIRVRVETDTDGDGSPDTEDPCPFDPDNDVDGDSICGDLDACNDSDGDGFGDPGYSNPGCAGVGDDNCPSVHNVTQLDGDLDGVGDDCDNCNGIPNSDQADGDDDGVGDVCDDFTSFQIAATRVVLTDNGDGDGIPDTNETVTVDLVVKNRSRSTLVTDLVARLESKSPGIACVSDSVINVGNLEPLQSRQPTDTFAFSLPGVERATAGEDLSVTLAIHFERQGMRVAGPQLLTIDLDLDVTTTDGSVEWTEDFETGFGSFEAQDMDAGIPPGVGETDAHGLARADGMRCQYNDPDNPDSNTYGSPDAGTCYPSYPDDTFTLTPDHDGTLWWETSDFRAYTGSHSLHFGFDDGGGSPSMPVAVMEAVRTTLPINLGTGNPSLSFKHQVKVAGEASGTASGNADRAVVQIQLADGSGDPAGPWTNLEPHVNGYDDTPFGSFFNCTFDPTDDGSTEDDLYAGFANRGASSTCNPIRTFNYLGDLDTFAANNVGNGDSGSGLPGALGPGTWVESTIDLSAYRGKRARFRFLSSSLKVDPAQEFVDDRGLWALGQGLGWWVDDIRIDDTLPNPATFIVDTNANTGLLTSDDSDGDGVSDACDICPNDPDPDQSDTNGDGVGDACGDRVRPSVLMVFPPDGSVDVTLSTDIVALMSEKIDDSTINGETVVLESSGVKVAGIPSVSTDGLQVSFNPDDSLQPGGVYRLMLSEGIRDLAGNPVVAFSSTFFTTANAGSGSIPPDQIGEEGGGAAIGGENADDHSGFSTASVGDVNHDGIADLLIGAPNADYGTLEPDAGKATLIFGSVDLQASVGNLPALKYRGSLENQFIGETVSGAGDMNDDGVVDMAIGSSRIDLNANDSGVVYLVFGNSGLDELAPDEFALGQIAACSTPTLCGIEFRGEAVSDLAGVSIVSAGDVNDDGVDDLLIGAPGASPAGRTGAGKVYLVYGGSHLTAGVVQLSGVGTTTPGLVFHGETAGDAAGASVAAWPDPGGIDDFLIGAPGATPTDEFGGPIENAGFVYSIHGGTANLDDRATGGVIELAAVASGAGNQVTGIVFLGTSPNGEVGRSVSGSVDTDGDGIDDIAIGAINIVWTIPGDGPKGQSGSSDLGPRRVTYFSAPRSTGFGRATEDFGARVYVADEGQDLGGLIVGGLGDVNLDGYEDVIIGAPEADVGGLVDAGTAYIVFGSPAPPPDDDLLLDDVGTAVAGFVVNGVEAGDQLGASVGGDFDVNGDGVVDILLGAPFADTQDDTPLDAGETYIISPISPDEVQQLVFATTTELEWTVTDMAVAYNVYRGSLNTMLSAGGVSTSAMTQLACGIFTDADENGLPDTTDTDPVPTGDGFIYLVTGTNLHGEGPIGSSDNDPVRINDAQCP
jgi:hypothetical protein